MITLRDKILEMFSIKTMDVYSSIASKLEHFFDKELLSKGIVKSSAQSDDFFSP